MAETTDDSFRKSNMTPRSPTDQNDSSVHIVMCHTCKKPLEGSVARCKCNKEMHADCAKYNLKRTQAYCSACYAEALRKQDAQKTTNTKPAMASTSQASVKSSKSAPPQEKPVKTTTVVAPPKATEENSAHVLKTSNTPNVPAGQSEEQLKIARLQELLDAANKKLETASLTHATEHDLGQDVLKSNPVAKPPSAHSSTTTNKRRVEVRALLERQAAIEAEMMAENDRFYDEKIKLLEEKKNARLEILRESSRALSQRATSLRSRSSQVSDTADVSRRTNQWVENAARPSTNKVTFSKTNDYGNIAKAEMNDPKTTGRNTFMKGARDARQSTPGPSTMIGRSHGTTIIIDDSEEFTESQLLARRAVPRDLPKFSGNPSDWPMFISTYHRTTARCGFSDEENMLRLRDALQGKAYEICRANLIIPRNVHLVISTLETRFGRPDYILREEFAKIKAFPEMSNECLEDYIRYHELIQNVCATQQSMGLEKALYDTLLMTEATSKLSPVLKMSWGRQIIGNDEESLMDLSVWLQTEAKIASKMSTIRDIGAGPSRSRSSNRIQTEKTRNMEKLYVNQEEELLLHTKIPEDEGMTCVQCDENHDLDRCPLFRRLSVHQRWDVINDKRLCRRCLGPHNFRSCEAPDCGVEGCPNKHHPLLHRTRSLRPRRRHRPQQSETTHSNPEQSTAERPTANEDMEPVMTTITSSPTIFRILPVIVHGTRTSQQIFAFIDEGSSVTMIEEDLARQLGLQGKAEELCLQWTGDTTKIERKSRRVALDISAVSSSYKTKISNVRTVEALGLPPQSVHHGELAKRYHHLNGLPIPSYSDASPKMLIGLAHWTICVPLETVEGRFGEPIATRCRLGWAVSGRAIPLGQIPSSQVHICRCTDDACLDINTQKFFATDNFGTGPSHPVESVDNQRALDILQRTTINKGKYYEVGLLWKYDRVHLPDSRPMARRRLECLKRKMCRDPKLSDNLHQQMKEYQEKNYVRQLSEAEAREHTPQTWYLPVFSVSNPNKPDKIRMVWDAAATVRGVSLNHQLLTGPDLLTPLPSVLYRFRQYCVAVGSDIKEMFHRVHIRKEDRKSQRFLWPDNNNNQVNVFEMNVMTFGATCSPSTAQYIKNTHADRYSQNSLRAVQAIQKCHYVDDYLDSFPSTTEAEIVTRQVAEIQMAAGFELRNWVSNVNSISQLRNRDIAKGKNLDAGTAVTGARVLGLWWDVQEDVLTFAFNPDRIDPDLLNCKRRPTKREVLRTLMLVFDPLGLIANILVQMKLLVQDLWRAHLDWDEEIGVEHEGRWMHWLETIPELRKLKIPRCYSTKLSTNQKAQTTLHIFVDASEDAFAAVAYLRVEDHDGVDLALIGAKTKVAPQKPLSIPKLELQAAVLGVRLARTIEDSHDLKMSQRTFWSDSSTVLAWLDSDLRKHQRFERFRLGEILECSRRHEWRYIPTKMNVADEGTKWAGCSDVKNNRWFFGPEFLYLSRESWPENRFTKCTNTDVCLMTTQAIPKENSATPDPNRFNSWTKLVRVQALVLRLILKRTLNKKLSDPITPAELQRAEGELFRRAQHEEFSYDIGTLLLTKQVDRSSKLHSLSPVVDKDYIIRVQGRITKIPRGITRDAVQPIILPTDNKITELIIMREHKRFHHLQHETVINELRQRYWIPKLRAKLKKLRKTCQRCRQTAAKPTPPKMGLLPPCRTATFARPFTHTGLDYFGPVEIAVQRHTEKRWVALFTCMTTRAIHLEIVRDLTTNSTIIATRSFMARRGQPITIWSDNGSNFRGASRELKDALYHLDRKTIQTSFATVEWKFIPPGAPHMGGCWERLVRSVKSILVELLRGTKPREDVLQAVLMEAEWVINSRPLTYVPLEVGEREALTPNHFLLGSSSGAKPIADVLPSPTQYKKGWKNIQQTADAFWKRWIKEYAPTLTRRQKWLDSPRPLQLDDVGYIWDENRRGSWQLGRITAVMPGPDGDPRVVKIRTSTGEYTRPSTKFARLDVAAPQGKISELTTVHGGENVGNAAKFDIVGNTATIDVGNTANICITTNEAIGNAANVGVGSTGKVDVGNAANIGIVDQSCRTNSRGGRKNAEDTANLSVKSKIQ